MATDRAMAVAGKHRTRKRGVPSLVALLAVYGGTGPVLAQDLGGAIDLGQLGADIGVNNAIRANVARSHAAPRPVVPRPAEAGTVRLSFAPSMAQRRKSLAQFVAKSRRRDPQGAAQVEKMFASGDVIDRINRQIEAYGFRADNVADAYAAWWLNAWLASRGRTDDPSRRQIDAVRAQAAQAMATLPQMANASNALKQEVAEAYLVQTALIGSHLEQARGNPEQLRRVSAAVSQGARASGLDLGAMELTENGFVSARTGALTPPTAERQGGAASYALGGVAVAAVLGGAYALGSRKAQAGG